VFLHELVTTEPSRRCWIRRRPQFGDQPQDLGEQHSRNGDLGHLEGDIAAVADELGADLDQFLPEAGQRPLLDWLGCRQRAEEVAEIVSECVKLKPDRVGLSVRHNSIRFGESDAE